MTACCVRCSVKPDCAAHKAPRNLSVQECARLKCILRAVFWQQSGAIAEMITCPAIIRTQTKLAERTAWQVNNRLRADSGRVAEPETIALRLLACRKAGVQF